jgi:transposase
MSNTPISMEKLRQIIRLKQEGYSNRKISQMLGLHRETVRRYVSQLEAQGLEYDLLLTQEDTILNTLFEKPKFIKTDAERLLRLQEFFPVMEKELGRVGVDKWNLWTEYKQDQSAGYTYSHFCREYKRWKQNQEVSAHFEYKAGDKVFIDYTGKKLFTVDKLTGEIKSVEVFVAILGFSNFIYVQATASQKKEDFIMAMENALHYFGGVPQGIVTDNLKSAVTKSCKYEPQLNETFESFALHYNTTILPTRAYKPKDKALVEGAVKIAYRRIFFPIRNTTFFSLGELNAEIRKLTQVLNTNNFQGKEHSRETLLSQIERKELKALPVEKYELKNFRWLTVQKFSHIYLSEDKHYYSVHYKYNGQKVKVAYTNSLVEVYLGYERIAVHHRDRKPSGYSTVKEHMPSSHHFVSQWNPEFFINWANGIGEPTGHFIGKILESKAHPEQGYKSCLGILSFAKKVGKERLNNACSRALCYGDYKYSIIKKILEKGLDKEPVQLEIPCVIPLHENIRGEHYYQ